MKMREYPLTYVAYNFSYLAIYIYYIYIYIYRERERERERGAVVEWLEQLGYGVESRRIA